MLNHSQIDAETGSHVLKHFSTIWYYYYSVLYHTFVYPYTQQVFNKKKKYLTDYPEESFDSFKV